MAVPANRRKGEVPFPEAGDGAYLLFTIDHMERLEGEIEGDYLPQTLERLASLKPISFFKTMFEMMLHGGDLSGFPYGLSIDDIKERMLDSIYLAVNGRTIAQFKEEQEKEMIASLKKRAAVLQDAETTEEKMVLGLAIMSQLGLSMDGMQDLIQNQSEDTPSSTSSDTVESPSE